MDGVWYRMPRSATAWRSLRLMVSVALVAGNAGPGLAGELPIGPSVAAGAVSIATPSGTSLIVNQSSKTAVVNWQQFSIGAGNSVTIDNGNGATLNRVTGTAPTRIDGSLNATGSVYLVNPAGVAVGPGGTVSTGGSFVASTHDVTNEAFMKGGDLSFAGRSTASVTNAGSIGSLGGDVALIARKVENTGRIEAANGVAGLAAGYEVLVRDKAQDGGRLQVKVGGADTEAKTSGTIRAASAELRANGGNVYALAGNTAGVVTATGTATSGGRIFLTAGDEGKVAVGGTVEATTPTAAGGTKGGDIRVSGGEATVSGSLSARGDGKGKEARGGTVAVTGKSVSLTGTARIDVGGSSGGVALVGGDYQGGRTAAKKKLAEPVANARTTSVAADAKLTADGTAGDGGAVVIWSDERTEFHGAISARGAGTAGNGGDAEVSGKAKLVYRGTADLTAAAGKTGTLLLDPYNVTISNADNAGLSGTTATQDDSVVNAHDLQLALGTANVTISTGSGGSQAGDITVVSRLYWYDNSTLTLSAAGSVNVNAPIVATGNTAGLVLEYGAGKGYSINAPVALRGTNPTLAIGESGNTQSYTLLRSMSDIDNIDSTGLGERYALAYDQDAAGTTYSSSLVSGTFTGTFLGMGNTISNLTISAPSTDGVGLFSILGGGSPATVRDLKLLGGSIVGSTNVGALAGNFNQGLVSQVRATASVTATSAASGGAGGLIGNAFGGTIDKSSAAGDVRGASWVGGLVGSGAATISNSYATGSVTGSGNYVGGLSGTASATVTGSYATGAVVGLGNDTGGLIGHASAAVDSSYATGEVVGAGTDVGGLVGSTSAAIAKSYATGAVSGLGDKVGGLVGSSNSSIDRTYATGAVVGGGGKAGGLVGAQVAGTVNRSYALGSVKAGSYVGGLIGQLGTGATLSQSYATGAVTGNESVGGLVGAADTGSVTASFWDKETTGRTGSAGGGSGLTTAEARQASSYTGWEFSDDWFQSADIRPIGRWEAASAVDGVVAVSNLHQLQLIGGGLSGSYRLANHIDAAPTQRSAAAGIWSSSGFAPLGDSSTPFTGTFDGDGMVIDGLSINRSSANGVGLFGETAAGSTVKNLGLDNGSVTGGMMVGALIGYSSSTVSNVWATTGVSGGSMIGGLVGRQDSSGSLTKVYFEGTVSGNSTAGGLVGLNVGTVSSGYSTGSVSASGGDAGGLVGLNNYSIEKSYASGAVSGGSGLGGLVGSNTGTVTDSYWDTVSTGQASSAGGGTGLSTAQARQSSSYTGFDFTNDWYQADDLRPIGRWELVFNRGFDYRNYWTDSADLVGPAGRYEWYGGSVGYSAVNNIRQLQLLRATPLTVGQSYATITYKLGRDIDATATSGSNAASIWSSAGFDPIGNTSGGESTRFSGVLDGSNHKIKDLTVNQPNGNSGMGLFGINTQSSSFIPGAVLNLSLDGGSITGRSHVGAIAGMSSFILYNVHSSASVTGSGDYVGGLVGESLTSTYSNYGTSLSTYITKSSASGSVTMTANKSYLGGLIGKSGSPVTDSYATGAVSGSGSQYIGGLIGYNNATATRVYATGAVSDGNRGSYIGGLIGYNTANIVNAYATGDVTVASYGTNVGGLVGINWSGNLTNVYATGTLSASGDDDQGQYIGGLIGQNRAGYQVTNAYASGKITRPSTGVNSSIGPVVGEGSEHYYTNVFWDTGTYALDPTDDETNLYYYTTPGTPLTTAQLRDSASYTNWNFTTDWFQTGDMRPIGRWEAASASQRNGTPTIGNLHQLALMETNLSGSYRLGANIDAAATAGTNASGVWGTGGFIPVGGGATAFSGALYGDRRTISNLTVNRSGTDTVGLIGATASGSLIRDLTMTGATIAGGAGAGVLTGTNAGTIVNASTAGTVGADSYAGGLSGRNSGFVASSSSSATVTAAGQYAGGLIAGMTGGAVLNSSASGAVTGKRLAGGLVGKLEGSSTLVSQVFATGAVGGTDFSGGFSRGGLVGSNAGATIDTAYATGEVSATGGSTGNEAGGLVGTNSGTIRNAYATGAVSHAWKAGGLVGSNSGDIANSYATGTVGQGGDNDVGGLIGTSSAGTLANLYATGAATGAGPVGGLIGSMSGGSLTDAFATGTVGGTWGQLGGLIGNMSAGSVTRAYATGGVSGSVSNVGGLIGRAASGTVTQTYATGSVSGSSQVGGLIGSSDATVSQSYATGSVTGTSNVGGLIGSGGGTVTASYWNTETTGQASSAAGSGLTTAQMRDWSSFSGWDGTVWAQPDSSTLPQLYGVSGVVGIDQAMTYGDDPATAAQTWRRGTSWWNEVSGTPTVGGLSATTNAGVSAGTVTGLTGTFRTGTATRFVGSATVAKAALSVTASGTMTYGSTSPTYSFTASGWKNGQADSNLTDLSYSSTASVTSDAGGTYTATASGGTLGGAAAGNYDIGYVAGTMTVTPATLTVTAGGSSTTYGDEVTGGAGYSVSGWKNGHTDALLSGVTVSSAVTATTDAGSYPATVSGGTLSGAASGNYTISYVNGTLTVAPAPLTVTAGSATMTYGGSTPTVGYTVSGWKNGHTDALLSGVTVSGASGVTATSNAGTYVTSASGGTLGGAASGNYTVSYVDGALTVAPAPLTVTAGSGSMTYGDSAPGIGYSVSGWKNGHTEALLSGVSTASGASSGSSVGSYSTTASGGTLGGAAAGNYAISYANGSVTVSPRALTITAEGKSRVYGDANPTFTYSVGGQGLVNGDGLSGALSTAATVTSGVGTYEIAQGSLAASGNYAITYNRADLTVTARPISVTADRQSRIYGDADPTFTYVVGGRGLANGDRLSGALSTDATVASGVGTYAIGRGTLAASANYSMSFDGSTMTVTARPIAVTADNLSRAVGAENPALTYTVGGRGLVNGDRLSGALTTDATAQSPAGTYAIARGTLAAPSNYELSYNAGILSVLSTGTAPTPTTPTVTPTPTAPAPAVPAVTLTVATDTSAMFSTIGVGKGTESRVVASPAAASRTQATGSTQAPAAANANDAQAASGTTPQTVTDDGNAGCVGGASASTACTTRPHPENLRVGRYLSFLQPSP